MSRTFIVGSWSSNEIILRPLDVRVWGSTGNTLMQASAIRPSLEFTFRKSYLPDFALTCVNSIYAECANAPRAVACRPCSSASNRLRPCASA